MFLIEISRIVPKISFIQNAQFIDLNKIGFAINLYARINNGDAAYLVFFHNGRGDDIVQSSKTIMLQDNQVRNEP